MSLPGTGYIFLYPNRNSKGKYKGINGKVLDSDYAKVNISDAVMYVTEREYNWMSVHPFFKNKENKKPLLVLKPR